MRFWFYRDCPLGYDWYLERDLRNKLEFGYEREAKCLTVFVGIWRLIISKPYKQEENESSS